MTSRMIFNESTMALPPLAFASPKPSPNTIRERRRRDAQPPLLKRKRTPPWLLPDTETSYLPNNASLPLLDCENFGTGLELPSQNYDLSLQLPSISLQPRSKRSRIDLIDSVSNEEQEPDVTYPPQIQEKDDDTIQTADAELSNPLKRSSSSRSMLSRTSSMNMTRSVSLQFNMSLMNLAGSARTSGDSGPLSRSTSSLLPQRRSIKEMTSSSSAKDMVQIQRENASNHRRSPVATTLDYLATAMLFPDVGIGLSI